MAAINAKIYEGSTECTPVLASANWRFVGSAIGANNPVYLPERGTFQEIFVRLQTDNGSDANIYTIVNPRHITHVKLYTTSEFNYSEQAIVNIYASNNDSVMRVELYQFLDTYYSPSDSTASTTMLVFVR